MRLLLLLFLALGMAAPAQAQIAAPNAAGLTFGHVHLNVADVAAQQAFWKSRFGGEPFRRGRVTGVKFPSLLILLDQKTPTGGSQGEVVDHFGFKVRDLQAFLGRWRAAGDTVQSEFTGNEGFPNAYVVGPDGVRIELQEDKTMKPEVVGHHVHFMTADHEKLLAWYVDTFGLEPFQRGRIATTANAPGMNLTFHPDRAGPTVPTQGRALDHIGFDFTDLDAEIRRIKAKGIKLEGPVRSERGSGLKSVFLTDPSGARIELTQGLAAY